MKRKFWLTTLAISGWGAAAIAAPPIDEAYIKSLAAPGKTALVIEYYDGKGAVAERKGFASETGYKALSGTDIQINDKITARLYGVKPCDGELVNRAEGFSGTCADYAKEQLQIMLQSPKVLFCRAFITELNASKQNVTCWGYYNYPNALDSIDMLEEQLVSNGSVEIARKADGSPERSDLLNAEKIGREGSFGMWADPRMTRR